MQKNQNTNFENVRVANIYNVHNYLNYNLNQAVLTKNQEA